LDSEKGEKKKLSCPVKGKRGNFNSQEGNHNGGGRPLLRTTCCCFLGKGRSPSSKMTGGKKKGKRGTNSTGEKRERETIGERKVNVTSRLPI